MGYTGLGLPLVSASQTDGNTANIYSTGPHDTNSDISALVQKNALLAEAAIGPQVFHSRL